MHLIRNHWRIKLVGGLALIAIACLTLSAWQSNGEVQDKQRSQDPSMEHARGLSRAFRKAAEQMLPTVVTIETHTDARVVGGDGAPPSENPFSGTPFEDFFNDRNRGGMIPRQDGMGSGVIVDPSGIILTNNHVVQGAERVLVRLSDGREFVAKDIKTDPETDLAVLKIDNAGSLQAASWGDSSQLEIGDWVIAVGNPFGLDSTVSAGIISGKGREIGSNQRKSYLQTDAAINPGNSGGPLANLEGEIVGINTAIASNSGGYQGIGFAVPSNLAKWVVEQLIQSGSVQRSWLGVGIEEVDAKLAESLGVKPGAGVLVTEVRADTPAQEAGLQDGDLILSFGDKQVRRPRDLQEMVERSEPGSRHQLHVLRDGQEINLEVVLRALPSDTLASRRDDETGRGADGNAGFSAEELGIDVVDLTHEDATRLGYEKVAGVLIQKVTTGSLADDAGLAAGMLIVKVGKQKVDNVEQFKQAMSDQSTQRGVLLLVRTRGGSRFIVLRKQ